MNLPKRFFSTCLLAIFLLLNSFYGKTQCNPLPTPYLQTFQSITANNQLPVCWASSPAQSSLTYSTTNSYGAFYNGSNVAYFFSPAFQMLAANQYSISLKYQANISAASTFTNISIYRNTSQNTVGMTFVNSFSPSINNTYNTWFTLNNIPADGNYYYIIQANASQTASPSYLNFDDFQINAICNTSPTSTVASVPSVCRGFCTTLYFIPNPGSGPLSYSWSNGATTLSTSVCPTIATTYTGIATNTINSCVVSSVTSFVGILPPMPVFLNASKFKVCRGEEVKLSASGAGTYSWSTNQTGPTINLTPQATAVYSVTGSTSICANTATMMVMVDECAAIKEAGGVTSMKIWSDNKILRVQLDEKEAADLKIFGVDGRVIYEGRIEGIKNEIDLEQINEQVLIVQLNTGDKIYRKKILVN